MTDETHAKDDSDSSESKRQKPSFVVGIGASAGGIEAMKALLSHVPADTGMAFVAILHLSPRHESMLSEILGQTTAMPVEQVTDEPVLEPDRVYVIPPSRDMVVVDGRLKLLSPESGPHRSVDRFFEALAETTGPHAIGVILSGTGSDGTKGLGAIKAEGGITFAQDATAQQEGMPRSAIAAGCVDYVMAPPQIGAELERIARHRPRTELVLTADQERPNDFRRLLALIRRATGVDFDHYKINTLLRRINRRMVLLHQPDMRRYIEYLERTPTEVEALYQDILISVTSFFRDADAFNALRERLKELIRGRQRHDPMRIWIIGCSTGEEAYSVAILVSEIDAELGAGIQAQIYGTDLNGAAIEKARAALYPRSIEADVTSERLRRFFVESDGGYRIAKPIRDMCVFARHNVLTDPPFSRMDVIGCRNVLIYIDTGAQRRLLPLLHYALKPKGLLFLGSSETIGAYRDLFEAEDAKSKIYARLETGRHPGNLFVGRSGAAAPRTIEDERGQRPVEAIRDGYGELQREADRILISRYSPPAVLVNAEGEVLQFRGETGAYLAPAPGKPSLSLLKMAREGLLVALRTALQRARKDRQPVREEGVRVRSNGEFRNIDLVVIPLRPDVGEPLYLVLFEDPDMRIRQVSAPPPVPMEGLSEEDKDRQIARLNQELAATRDYLQSVIEQQEAANEELQSANEEVQSANEELQSINEELETSREEIQSSNEELTTVNDELHNRNQELNRANDDLHNLLASVQMGIVMVSRDLRIRRFTPAAERLLNLIASDIGRPIGDIQLKIDGPDIEALVREVIDTITPRELEVYDRSGRWYSLRVRPYRTVDSRIDGAVIVLVDIHALKQSQETLTRQLRILEQTQEPILVRRADGQIVYWNRGAELVYGYTKEDAIGKNAYALLLTETESGLRAMEDALARDGHWSGELSQRTRAGRAIQVESQMALVREGEQLLVIETNRDVTESKALEAALQRRVRELATADEQKNLFVAMLAHELRNPLAPMRNALEIMKRHRLDPENESLREMVARQVGKIARIVDDLLEAALVTGGKIDLRLAPADLSEILGHVVDAVEPALRARNQRFSLSLPGEPMPIYADAQRLEQVFGNLLDNAIKFTPEGGAIELQAARETDDAGQWARVTVRDDGAGMAPELLPHVFELFVQGDQSPARERGGLGIGLCLARNLVEGHGGAITAHSEGPGRGSSFVVRLPIRSAADASVRPPQRPERAALPPMRILIVDDNADFRSSLGALLSFEGHVVLACGSGGEALEAASAFKPSVVLLDIGLPDLDGYEVARRLRDLEGLAEVPIVALTGYGEPAIAQRVRAAGIDRHVVKPVEADVLLKLLTELSPDASRTRGPT